MRAKINLPSDIRECHVFQRFAARVLSTVKKKDEIVLILYTLKLNCKNLHHKLPLISISNRLA